MCKEEIKRDVVNLLKMNGNSKSFTPEDKERLLSYCKPCEEGDKFYTILYLNDNGYDFVYYDFIKAFKSVDDANKFLTNTSDDRKYNIMSFTAEKYLDICDNELSDINESIIYKPRMSRTVREVQYESFKRIF